MAIYCRQYIEGSRQYIVVCGQYIVWTVWLLDPRLNRPEKGQKKAGITFLIVLTQQNERNRWNSLCTRFPFYWGVLKCHSYITIYCITRISKLSFFCIITHWILSRILLHFDIQYFGEFCRCINSQFLLHCVEFC